MLILLSPAKSLDFTTPLPADLARAEPHQPLWPGASAELITLLRQQDVAGIAALMALSDDLARLNRDRYKAWRRKATAQNSRPAILAFDGDVYGGLEARSLRPDDLDWAQGHVLMLSGLYGLLEPLHALQPYRLEMGTRLANPAGADLYAYWREKVSAELRKRCGGGRRKAEQPTRPVLNLASQEYARVVDRRAVGAPFTDVVFEDRHEGRWKIISFNAKRARGLLARHAILNRIEQPAQLAGFSAEGWALDGEVSTPEQLVFRRDLQGERPSAWFGRVAS